MTLAPRIRTRNDYRLSVCLMYFWVAPLTVGALGAILNAITDNIGLVLLEAFVAAYATANVVSFGRQIRAYRRENR